jgi:hypothetical protein
VWGAFVAANEPNGGQAHCQLCGGSTAGP